MTKSWVLDSDVAVSGDVYKFAQSCLGAGGSGLTYGVQGLLDCIALFNVTKGRLYTVDMPRSRTVGQRLVLNGVDRGCLPAQVFCEHTCMRLLPLNETDLGVVLLDVDKDSIDVLEVPNWRSNWTSSRAAARKLQFSWAYTHFKCNVRQSCIASLGRRRYAAVEAGSDGASACITLWDNGVRITSKEYPGLQHGAGICAAPDGRGYLVSCLDQAHHAAYSQQPGYKARSAIFYVAAASGTQPTLSDWAPYKAAAAQGLVLHKGQSNMLLPVPGRGLCVGSALYYGCWSFINSSTGQGSSSSSWQALGQADGCVLLTSAGLLQWQLPDPLSVTSDIPSDVGTWLFWSPTKSTEFIVTPEATEVSKQRTDIRKDCSGMTANSSKLPPRQDTSKTCSSAGSSNKHARSSAGSNDRFWVDRILLDERVKHEQKKEEHVIQGPPNSPVSNKPQAIEEAGDSMNYCQVPGVGDACFDRERLTTCIEDGLEKALTTVVDLLHQHTSGPYQAELTRFMQPLLLCIDPEVREAVRICKHALRHSLLLQLDRWVWAPAAGGEDISSSPIAGALATACPALRLRPVVAQQAFVYREMEEKDGAKAVTSLNKLLCAVQTSSGYWYQLWEPILKDSTSNYADLLGNAVRPLLVPQLLGADMGLPSLAADEGAVAELEEPMYRLLFTAVMLRLCAEASHPAHLVEVTAGTRRWAYNLAPRANPELYGGVGNEACRRTFAWSSQLHPSAAALAASPVGCVAGCYRPGIRLQQSLMLVDLNSTTRRVFDERYVSLGQM